MMYAMFVFNVQDQTLQEVMQEGLQHHATGVKYRERNAGTQIDEHMQDPGKQNKRIIDRTAVDTPSDKHGN